MQPNAFTHPRDEIVESIGRIYRHRMTTTSGGNLSIRDDEAAVWITPAGIDKGTLTARDIACLTGDGRQVGPHAPSSELPFHQAIYQCRPDLGAIVHAHPQSLVAFSICRKTPDTNLLPLAAHVIGRVGYAAYELPGSAELGEKIAEQFKAGFNAVILENHGVVIGGTDMAEAFGRFETLEFTAKTIIKASALGEVRYLSDAQVAAAAKLNAAMPGLPPHRPSSRERELRAELAAFVHRGYRQRLLTSKEGSFSVRIGPDRFLISPTAMDREKVGVEDMVLVADGQREAGKVPSRTAWLHRAVYRKHPGVQAVVNALPINATAFSCSGHRLDARTIPESYIFLRDVPVVPFSAFDGVGEALAGHVSLNQPAALLENNGALIVGKSCLDVFDRLEVLESTADTLITSRPLGPLCAMEEGHIKRLEEVFFPKVYGG